MKAVIIGASSEALHTIKQARDSGLYVTALDGNPAAEGLQAADQGLVVDISDERAVIEAVREEGADFVLTVPIGRYLTTIGAVNDALSLPGISREMAAACTDKYRFHLRLKERNLRACHCYAVGGIDGERPDEIRKKLSDGSLEIAYPVILKPRFGSGSRGIRMLESEGEMDAELRVLQEEWVRNRERQRSEQGQDACEQRRKAQGEAEYVLEECVPGEEYGVDGAVIEGHFHMVLLRKKVNTPPPVRQAVGYFSVLPEDGFWQQAWEYMNAVVSCLGLDGCLFHADLIRSTEGPFVIELSARPSGHNLHNLFTPLCTGIDMAREYINYRMGKAWSFTPKVTRQAMIHYFDLQGRVVSVPTKDQVRQKEPALIGWECHVRAGEELGPVSDGHSLMGRGYFILEGREEELRVKADRVKALFQLA